MGTKLTTTEIAEILPATTKAWELILNRVRTKADIQAFIDGKPSLPAWALPTTTQIARARVLNKERGWGFGPLDFPSAPFGPKVRSNAITLLAVYLPGKGRIDGIQRTIDEHLAVIHQQYQAMGKKVPYLGIKTDPYHMRLKSNRQDGSVIVRSHRPGLRWVTYEYDAYHSPKHGHSVADLWAGNTSALAASEVLSALMLFPEYGPSMDGKVTPYVNLAGYEVSYPGEKVWSCYPTIGHRMDDGDFVMSVGSATDPAGSEVRASPVFREI